MTEVLSQAVYRAPSPLGLLGRLLSFVPASSTKARLVTRSCRSGGRRFSYGEVDGSARASDGASDGGAEACPTVVLLHGWGLAHSSYRRPAEALGAQGCHVLVPDLPGFGWTPDLPYTRVTFERFAEALEGFLRAVLRAEATGAGASVGEPVPVAQPVHVVGHSFGGAVAVQLAHDAPDLVASVSLVSAASGVTWSRGPASRGPASEDASQEDRSAGNQDNARLLSERPVWDWALHLIAEFPLRGFPVATLPVVRDLGHNLIWHLPSMGLVAHITRHSDMRSVLSSVVADGTPVHLIRGCNDRVVTAACFEDQCLAAACTGTLVEGNHGWPLTDPDEFAAIISELIFG